MLSEGKVVYAFDLEKDKIRVGFVDKLTPDKDELTARFPSLGTCLYRCILDAKYNVIIKEKIDDEGEHNENN